METKDRLQQLLAQLQQSNVDIKAEIVLWQAITAGVQRGELVVKNSRFFEREYARDIASCNIVEDDWYRCYMEVQLTRPGFYDMLPESLFFQPGTNDFHRRMGAAEMAAQYQQHKQKERELRLFFQPFENEVFHQQLMLEKEEVALLDALNNKALNRFLVHFWNLPVQLPIALAASFILLMPYAHHINGNIAFMQQCLELLLNERVAVVVKNARETQAAANLQAGLGQQNLGDSMICGNSFYEDYPVLQYTIGPLQHSPVTGYVKGGLQYLLLETFNRFFAPVEADIIIDVEVEREAAVMRFTEEEQPVLGYSSVL
ncbi:Type VI secretion, VasB, ImpH, VC_A0111 [Filimonas lacunae]|uniref:Type VI secretion, VasB, ImpH, VC_A0111 n=1 Tax=Filimonas lacunae TaxID=477680 RepID=A0A173MR70_9BACT|nr:type VI secretion system baseplate subunit TssG [Filimonas lacunae]BAV10175.1 hypothetical protein FLA_6235 [Filimonas lacunae]SIT18604.1 Type VI secretion, VasB, ImpH, VC_A0111 [Filimonas lacunae]